MVFTVMEINNNSSLLPGVKLGYRIVDGCDHVPTSLKALLSLVSHLKSAMSEGDAQMERGILKRVDKEMSKAKFYAAEMSKRYLNNTVSEESMAKEQVMKTIPVCLADSPVAAVIGLASSSPTGAAAHILGSFNIPLVIKSERGAFTLLYTRQQFFHKHGFLCFPT